MITESLSTILIPSSNHLMSNHSEETLWEMMRFLYPNLTLDDFYEVLEVEGWYDTITRIIINLKN